jgi:hypothetical protein
MMVHCAAIRMRLRSCRTVISKQKASIVLKAAKERANIRLKQQEALQKVHQLEMARVKREAQRRVVEVVWGRWVNAQLSRAWATWYKQVKETRAKEEEEHMAGENAVARPRAPTLDTGLGSGAVQALLNAKSAPKVTVRQRLYEQMVDEAERRGWNPSLELAKLKPPAHKASGGLTASGSAGRSSFRQLPHATCFAVDASGLMRGKDIMSTYQKSVRYCCLLHHLPLLVVVCHPDHPEDDEPGHSHSGSQASENPTGSLSALSSVSTDREYVDELLRVRRHVETLLFADETLLEVGVCTLVHFCVGTLTRNSHTQFSHSILTRNFHTQFPRVHPMQMLEGDEQLTRESLYLCSTVFNGFQGVKSHTPGDGGDDGRASDLGNSGDSFASSICFLEDEWESFREKVLRNTCILYLYVRRCCTIPVFSTCTIPVFSTCMCAEPN